MQGLNTSSIETSTSTFPGKGTFMSSQGSTTSNEKETKYNERDFSVLTGRIFGSKDNVSCSVYGNSRRTNYDTRNCLGVKENQNSNRPFSGKQLRWNIRNFEIGPIRGRGKYGVVFKARLISTKQVVALKVLNKQELEQDHMHEQLRKEVEIHSRLKHPNIVQLLGYFDDPKRVYLVLEYAAGGELYKNMKKQPNGRFTEEQAAKYIAQLTSALSMCHRYNIIHRDVKPENLLLSADGRLKLADFGWAVHDRRGFHNYSGSSSGASGIIANLGSRRTTMCGTLDYLAPEMVNGHSYDETVDNWTVGVLAYELIVGHPPFESDDIEDNDEDCGRQDQSKPSSAEDDSDSTECKQRDGNFGDMSLSTSLECENVATFRRITSLRYHCPKFMSDEAKQLIKKLLNRDPALRLTLEEVLESPWIKKYLQKDELSSEARRKTGNPFNTINHHKK